MPLRAAAIPARYYARIGEVLAGMGVDVADLFAAAGVDFDAIQRADAHLTLSQANALFAEAVRRISLPDLAFLTGKSLKISSHGILGYGMVTSPTLGYTLRLVSRYFSMITPAFAIRLRHTGKEVIVDLTPIMHMPADLRDFEVQTIAISWHWEVLELLRGKTVAYDMYLPLPTPSYVSRYEALAGGRFHFGTPMHEGFRIVYPAAVMKQALPLADPAALELAERRCDEMVRHIRQTGSLADWVRQMLWDARDEWPSLSELAKALNMSPRTLDRTLEKEGVRFRDISKSIRHERACALLADETRTVLDIALELGYTDSANFTRAFRAQAGIPPSQWRKDCALRHPGRRP